MFSVGIDVRYVPLAAGAELQLAWDISMRKSLLLVPILLLLTSCIGEQKHQEAQCETEAERRGSGDDMADLMQECMEASGYKFDWKHGTCPIGKSSVTNPYCYTPKSWAGRIGYSIELWTLQVGLRRS